MKATTKLGHFYYSGIKSNSNLSEQKFIFHPNQSMALKKYIRAGRRGDSEAFNCAGLLIEETNPIDAVEYYKKAIAIDDTNTDAMFNMALLYYSKKEEAEWHQDALEIMEQAAKLGNLKAKQYLEDLRLSFVLTKGSTDIN